MNIKPTVNQQLLFHWSTAWISRRDSALLYKLKIRLTPLTLENWSLKILYSNYTPFPLYTGFILQHWSTKGK